MTTSLRSPPAHQSSTACLRLAFVCGIGNTAREPGTDDTTCTCEKHRMGAVLKKTVLDHATT